MLERMKHLGIWCRRILWVLGGSLLLLFSPAVFVNAEEATFTPGMSWEDIQTVLDRAKSSDEPLVVTFQAGGEYTLDKALSVHPNTTVEAEGATIRASVSGERALHIGDGENVLIHGGTWIGKDFEAVAVVNTKGNVTLDSITVNMSGGNFERSIQISGGAGLTVKNCHFIGAKVYACDMSGMVFSGNTIQGSKSLSSSSDDSSGIGFSLDRTANCQITNNKISDSDCTGLDIRNDSGSIIEGNTVSNSIARTGINSGEKHGEGLIVWTCTGTQVLRNTVTDTHSRVENNGNGIMITVGSQNVLAKDNRVENSGNHGIQVSYQSKNITLSHNVVINSGNMGVSVSRGSQADLKDGNEISNSGRFGVTFDGREGVTSGSVTNCIVSGGGEGGICLDTSAIVTANQNTLIDNKSYGIRVTVKSTLNAAENKIYMTSQQTAEGSGIAVHDSSATLEKNIIGNYPRGIYGNNSIVNGSNNVVNYEKADSSQKSGYFMENSSGIVSNTLFKTEITETVARGVCSVSDLEAGVIVGGTRYSVRTRVGEWFEPSYPKQSDWNSIIVYVIDNSGNAICVNTEPTFDIHNTQVDSGNAGGNPEEIRAFVTRLYQLVLRRQPEGGEDQDWINKLISKEKTGAEVAQGFFFSREFTEVKKVSDEEYVNILYRTMMNREADAEGFADWTGKMQKGMSREYVYHGFAESVEFTNLCKEYGIERGSVTLSQARDQNPKVTEFVARNYLKALERTFEEDGLNDWCNRLLTGIESPKQVVKGFVFSDEFKNKNHSNEKFLTILYATYFDRSPDEKGYQDWLTQLQNGATRETVEAGFAEGEEFNQLIQSFGLN